MTQQDKNNRKAKLGEWVKGRVKRFWVVKDDESEGFRIMICALKPVRKRPGWYEEGEETEVGPPFITEEELDYQSYDFDAGERMPADSLELCPHGMRLIFGSKKVEKLLGITEPKLLRLRLEGLDGL